MLLLLFNIITQKDYTLEEAEQCRLFRRGKVEWVKECADTQMESRQTALVGDGENEQKQKENELDMDNSVMIMLESGGQRRYKGDKW